MMPKESTTGALTGMKARWMSSLSSVTGAAAVPYGFTLVISGTVLALVRHRGIPSDGEVFAFGMAGVVGFALLGVIAHRRASVGRTLVSSEEHMIMTGITNVVAVAVCLGEATLIAQLPRWLAWPLAALAVVPSYLAIVALQHAASHRQVT